VFISSEPALLPSGPVVATQVKDLIMQHVFEGSPRLGNV
jgi:hypothetical protein